MPVIESYKGQISCVKTFEVVSIDQEPFYEILEKSISEEMLQVFLIRPRFLTIDFNKELETEYVEPEPVFQLDNFSMIEAQSAEPT